MSLSPQHNKEDKNHNQKFDSGRFNSLTNRNTHSQTINTYHQTNNDYNPYDFYSPRNIGIVSPVYPLQHTLLNYPYHFKYNNANNGEDFYNSKKFCPFNTINQNFNDNISNKMALNKNNNINNYINWYDRFKNSTLYNEIKTMKMNNLMENNKNEDLEYTSFEKINTNNKLKRETLNKDIMGYEDEYLFKNEINHISELINKINYSNSFIIKNKYSELFSNF